MKEVQKHPNGKALVRKAIRVGYYWSCVLRDRRIFQEVHKVLAVHPNTTRSTRRVDLHNVALAICSGGSIW